MVLFAFSCLAIYTTPVSKGGAIGLLIAFLVAFFSFIVVESSPIPIPWKWVFRIGFPPVFFYAIFMLSKRG